MKPIGLEKASALSYRSVQWFVSPTPSTRSCWLRNKHHLAARPPAVSRPESADPSDTQGNILLVFAITLCVTIVYQTYHRTMHTEGPSRWELQQLAESMGSSNQDNALQWLDDTGRALVDEAEEHQAQLAQQEASRQFLQASSNIQPQALQATIDETGTARQPYYKRLMAMAQAGQVADARSIMDEMEAEGMPAGARAYHGLIYAHVRAGDANGALLAIKEEYAAGTLVFSPHNPPSCTTKYISQRPAPLTHATITTMHIPPSPHAHTTITTCTYHLHHTHTIIPTRHPPQVFNPSLKVMPF